LQFYSYLLSQHRANATIIFGILLGSLLDLAIEVGLLHVGLMLILIGRRVLFIAPLGIPIGIPL